MPNGRHNGRNGPSPGAVAQLLTLTAAIDRRTEEWRQQLHAILRQHEDLENRRGLAVARALRLALDPLQGGRRAFADGGEVDLHGLVETYERSVIEWALAMAHGCQKDAAVMLGVGPTTLHEKMKRLGLITVGAVNATSRRVTRLNDSR